MEEKLEVVNAECSSSDSFLVDSDEDDLSSLGQDDLHPEQPLTEQDIEELIAEFLEVESKAAEAQETLENESLTKVEAEVREELAQTVQGDDLETAVAEEMTTFREEWEVVIDELETESAHLLEQLDGAGIDLPSLYKLIESQASKACCTEAWKKRAHWVGSQLTSEITESVADAEKYLQVHRPVRKRHGKLLEEGASGFLQKKLAADGIKDTLTGSSDIEWSSLNKVFSDNASDAVSFGGRHWASVYLASTPQQAAAMGLEFPGVNEVEEIEEIDACSSDPFIADAIANERELALSEEQRKNFKKVNEEDDVNIDRKLQLHLKRRRIRKKTKQAEESEIHSDEPLSWDGNSDFVSNKNSDANGSDDERTRNNETTTASPVSALLDDVEPRGTKRSNESEDPNPDNKKHRTVIIDVDEIVTVNDELSCTNRKDHTVGHEDVTVGVESLSPQTVTGTFHCTVCLKVTIEVHKHPLLKVIVCGDCKCLLEEKMVAKDVDCSECYCGWCGQNTDLVSCKSCKNLFCTTCVKRNISEECLLEIQSSGWQCCCCSPSILQKLMLEFEKATGYENSTDSSSDSDSENLDMDINIKISSKRKQKKKKKIRRILDDTELGEETKRKIAIEKERQERLKSLQGQFSSRADMMTAASCIKDLPAGANVKVLGDASTGYIVNVVRESSEEAVKIPPSISAKLKAHQIAGIRFMWENIIQSIRKVKSGDKGLGCILAHTMGLGKTLQVIAFLYTAMRSVDLGLRTALIVTPVNVLHNWRQEFLKWRPSELKPLRIYMLEDVSRERRTELLAKWKTKGGVFLIGYTAFRNLSSGKQMKDQNSCALQDGADILVCDEAHIIKNTKAGTTQTLKQVKCQRRIALTGSPLQNNLMEYFCMVDFVREGFLGSSLEFRNRFQNPIENGQHITSTSEDVKIMNQRSHILYEQLKGFVQRMDMSVMKNDLPPKTVFVMAVKLSPIQRKLYKRFLDVHGLKKNRVSDEIRKISFFAAYQALAQIWNHPGILQLRKERSGSMPRERAVDNFIADHSSSDENIDYSTVVGEKPKNINDVPDVKNDDEFFQKDWWSDILHENNYRVPEHSGKMVLLLDILTICSDVGDKALVFSQSLTTLDLIEFYLSKFSRRGKQGKFWKKGKDWYRLDGRTESLERQKLVERFNEPTNKRVKCALISTRAGSLGINLQSANRVIIVDGSWNPTHDIQAIYRAWRYGQTKPVFVYRLMAHGTMEDKIYKRQVTKEGLAARVVDRQQVHRTMSKEDMLHLFEFGDDENNDTLNGLSQNINCQVGSSLKHKVPVSNGSCSSDKLMESLLRKHSPRWIENYHEHETLLQENEDEKLTKEEQDMAWEMYRKTMEWEEMPRAPQNEYQSWQKPAVSNMARSTPEQKPTFANLPPLAPEPKAAYANLPPLAPEPKAAYANLPPRVPEPKPVCSMASVLSETSFPIRARGRYRSRIVQRPCTNLSHLLTLRSQGIKSGAHTVCGECARIVSWENIKT